MPIDLSNSADVHNAKTKIRKSLYPELHSKNPFAPTGETTVDIEIWSEAQQTRTTEDVFANVHVTYSSSTGPQSVNFSNIESTLTQSTQTALSDSIFSDLVDQENLHLLSSSVSTGDISTSPTSTTQTTKSTTATSLPDKTCGSQSLSSQNGKWFCNEDVVQKGTLCELKCYAGFYSSDAKMKRRCICNKKGVCKWNHVDVDCLTTPPEPIEVVDPPTCTVLQSDLNTGYWDCSNQNKNGSRCSLLCFSGYEQKRTNRRCRCKGDSCEWKGPDRQCVASSVFTTPPPSYNEVCETVLSDPIGEWSCTDENNSNSKCKLQCPSGYRPSASPTRRCRCQATES